MKMPDIEVRLVGEDDPVNDPHHFAAWLYHQIFAQEPIAIDTETTGLKWWEPRFTRLVQFGVADSGWAIPVDWYGRLVHWALEEIRDAGVPVVMHNASFDMHALESDGYPVPDWRNIHDTMLLHHIVEPHKPHGLKPISKRYLGKWAGFGQGELTKLFKAKGWSWDTVPVDRPEYWAYGVLDTCLTRLVYDILESHIDPAYEREMAYRAVMYRCETRGMRVDNEYTSRLLGEWQQRIAELRQELHSLGVKNPNSNRQVEDALVANGWSPTQFTETGQAQLDKTILAALAAEGATADIVVPLVEYKRLVKWSSTYLETFLDDQDSDGYVHPSIRTMGARTGRSSITNPPLQTLPHTSHVRNCVIPNEGEQLYAIDYDGQEARLFAAYSREPAMLDLFRNGDGDIHTLVANQITQPRDVAKMVNFLILYGGGAGKLSWSLGIPKGEAEGIISQYHRTFPQASDFMRKVDQQARARLQHEGDAYVTTVGGRRVVADPDKIYSLVNYLIQGSGADVAKDAAIRLDQAGLADNIVVPVHDEFLVSCSTSEEAEEMRILMETEVQGVPLTCGCDGPLARWGDKYGEA